MAVIDPGHRRVLGRSLDGRSHKIFFNELTWSERQALAIGQLREGHAEVLIETREPLDLVSLGLSLGAVSLDQSGGASCTRSWICGAISRPSSSSATANLEDVSTKSR
jgi:hypothetical protein